MSFAEKMKVLSPTSFENLVFDLLVRRGLVNVSWRTPGADGGRDIEGDFQVNDFSGGIRLERWYVECKRYETAIDWPTVSGKIAYAENHDADYLLICTTSTLSPKCKDEITRREHKGKKPHVRFWEGSNLDTLVSFDELLQVKYGLSERRKDIELGIINIATASTKAIQASYGHYSSLDNVHPSLELAAALAELVTVFIDSGQMALSLLSRFDQSQDSYSWCDVVNYDGNTRVNRYTTRAILTCLKYLGKANIISIAFNYGTCYTQFRVHYVNNINHTLKSLLSEICVVGNFEWISECDGIIFRQRSE